MNKIIAETPIYRIHRMTGESLTEAGQLFNNCLADPNSEWLSSFIIVYVIYKKRPEQTKYRQYMMVDYITENIQIWGKSLYDDMDYWEAWDIYDEFIDQKDPELSLVIQKLSHSTKTSLSPIGHLDSQITQTLLDMYLEQTEDDFSDD